MTNHAVNTQPQVLVTRPSPYGEALCSELEAENFFSLHVPLIRFKPNNTIGPEQRLVMLEQADTWIFVSRQAVNFCFSLLNHQQLQQLQQASLNKSVIAVGSATAHSLQQIGFKALVPATPNSEGMIQIIEHHHLQQATTLLIRGSKGRELLEQYFQQGQLSFLPVYERIESQHQFPQISIPELTAVVVTSGQLMELTDKALSPIDNKDQITIIAGSERINKMAQHMGYANCYTAKDASNLELVKSCILWRNNVC